MGISDLNGRKYGKAILRFTSRPAGEVLFCSEAVIAKLPFPSKAALVNDFSLNGKIDADAGLLYDRRGLRPEKVSRLQESVEAHPREWPNLELLAGHHS
jgi:hypothetical protein